MGDEGGSFMQWVGDHWRVVLTAASVVTGMVAFGHAAFYWELGTSPSAVGVSYGELAGQTALGTVVFLIAFLTVAVVVGWLVLGVATVRTEAPVLVPQVRAAGRRTRVALAGVLLLAIATWYGLTRLPTRAALNLLAVGGVAVGLTLVFARAAGARRPTRDDAGVPWQPAWGAGVVGAASLFTSIAAFDADGQAGDDAVTAWIVSLFAALVVGVVTAGLLVARRHRRGTMPARLNRAAVAVTAAGAVVAMAAITGLGVAHNSRLVKHGVAPRGRLHAFVGAPVQCVRVHWIATAPPPPLPEHALRLGSAAGHVVLFDAGSGPMFAPAGAVHTASAPAERCFRR